MKLRRRKIRVLGVLVLGIAIVGFVIFRWSKPEPLYEGKPVSYWIGEINSSNLTARADAFGAFFRVETNAIPFLLRTLEVRESLFHRAVNRVRPKLPASWRRRLPVPNDNISTAREIVVSALWITESKTNKAVPALLIYRFGPAARSAVPVLCDILKTGPDQWKLAAVRALVSIGTSAKAAVPVLIEVIQRDQDWPVRLEALNALRQISPDDEAVTNAIVGVLLDPNDEVRLRVVEISLDRQRDFKTVMPALLLSMKSSDAQCRWRAMVFLRMGGTERTAAVTVFIERLKDENDRVRAFAATILGEIGPDAHAAVSALRELHNDEHANVREAAVAALKKISAEGAQ